jgi:hypothetical protein
LPAPIALFVYNRLSHTQQTIHALKKNALAKESDLFIFADGVKSASDSEKVSALRNYLLTIDGFNSVTVTESHTNQGLANSIINGISRVLENHEEIIVLEDDMVTSPYFLTYMNQALSIYQSCEDVISIHGYIYPVKHSLPETFFLKGADCWGWATWKRGWALFEADGAKLLKELKQKKLTNEFDFNGSYGFTKMLVKQIKGQNNSWAIRWYAAAFLKNKLTLYPGRSLVNNIGNDTSGTHSWDSERFEHSSLAQTISLKFQDPKENLEAKKIIGAFLKTTEPFVAQKVIAKLKFWMR